MKLIDLLKIELPKRGGWPEGANYIACDKDGQVDSYRYIPVPDSTGLNWKCSSGEGFLSQCIVPACSCSDWDSSIITREQYEASVASETSPTSHSAHSFLEKGVQHMKDRAAQRDSEDGERSMKACVDAFNAMFGHSLTETQGWQFMVLLKMARSRNKFNPDDYEDGAAYTGLAGEAHSNEKK